MKHNGLTRREFLSAAGISTAAMALGSGLFAAEPKPTNVLLITADDANWDSFGCTGCRAPNISPNIDALAAQGIRFEHAHVTSAICQPSRSVIGTGRYPHRNGALGFDPIRTDVPTIVECFRSSGYYTGILAKVEHMAPPAKFPWDVVVKGAELGNGRNPQLYYQHTKALIEQAKAQGKPFFLMANSQDPHRPFPSIDQPSENVSRIYKPEEVDVPGFLPQGIPDIQKEIAQYYTAVHRCDETVGQILRALRDAGAEENTMVIFLSDNGISVPFAKTNCYENSTKTPLIIRWPGKIKPGLVDKEHFVSGIDLMPTLIDALGLKPVEGMDGTSFAPILRGVKLPGRDKVFTFITSTAGRRFYPMRSVRTATRSYIFNAWSDGKTEFQNEPMSGLTWNAMVRAGKQDSKIAARCDFFLHRVPEEFYDLTKDPCELNNLIDSRAHREEIDQLRAEMLDMMKSTSDPLLDEFRKKIGA
ncbi:MAG: sulfatase [Armatimonadota bacterium]|nr:sulfatase [Armatimonadota bacterium]